MSCLRWCAEPYGDVIDKEELRGLLEVRSRGSPRLKARWSGYDVHRWPGVKLDPQGVSVVELFLFQSHMQRLADGVGDLRQLSRLTLTENWIQEWPAALSCLQNLQWLAFNENRLEKVPPSIQFMKNLSHLDLSNNNLREVPRELGRLNSLTLLNLGHNRLHALPPELGNLHDLKYLELNGNMLEELPAALRDLRSLRFLYVDNNKLVKVPDSIGVLAATLKELWLCHNMLTYLPAAFLKSNGIFLKLDGNPVALPAETDAAKSTSQQPVMFSDFNPADWNTTVDVAIVQGQ